MKALDLFCCDGGAAMGLYQAGFDEIVGIDIEPHPNYPFEFIQADAIDPPIDLQDFDFIWASPPCQAYSFASKKHIKKGKIYPELVNQTKRLLNEIGRPYCIENVIAAPIRKDLLLCGTMFNLNIFRHRKFQIFGFRCEQPRHPNHLGSIKPPGKYVCVCGEHGMVGFSMTKHQRERLGYVTCAGHGGNDSGKLSVWQEAMGIHHISNKKYLAEAVPPSYSKYIGKEFFRTREFYETQIGTHK